MPLTLTHWSWPTPHSITLTSPGGATIESEASVTGVGGHSVLTQCWVRVGYHSIGGGREGQTHHCEKVIIIIWIRWSWCNPLTQVSTEGHISSSSWYSATVGPSWSEGVVGLPPSQSDDLRTIPVNVELLSSSHWSTIAQYHTSIRIRPLSQWSHTIVVSNTSTAVSEVSVTVERREKTTIIIISSPMLVMRNSVLLVTILIE